MPPHRCPKRQQSQRSNYTMVEEYRRIQHPRRRLRTHNLWRRHFCSSPPWERERSRWSGIRGQAQEDPGTNTFVHGHRTSPQFERIHTRPLPPSKVETHEVSSSRVFSLRIEYQLRACTLDKLAARTCKSTEIGWTLSGLSVRRMMRHES